ncbi:hypothetical protein, partial [Nitrospira sp. BLG_2]|uniref:hypothetical protein n=1 Tax=Nitrospira sp. BLG_2 TaxID=3397507 RepID=UPI003B9D626F
MKCLRYWGGLLVGVMMFILVPNDGNADNSSLEVKVRERAASIEAKLIAWRRDIHQHPELGDQETRTSRLVSEHLR